MNNEQQNSLPGTDNADPLYSFSEGQWWIRELDGMVGSSSATVEQKRAVAVVHHLLRAAALSCNRTLPAQSQSQDKQEKSAVPHASLIRDVLDGRQVEVNDGVNEGWWVPNPVWVIHLMTDPEMAHVKFQLKTCTDPKNQRDRLLETIRPAMAMLTRRQVTGGLAAHEIEELDKIREALHREASVTEVEEAKLEESQSGKDSPSVMVPIAKLRQAETRNVNMCLDLSRLLRGEDLLNNFPEIKSLEKVLSSYRHAVDIIRKFVDNPEQSLPTPSVEGD